MEEQIIDILKKSDKALSVNEINDILGYKTVDELKDLLKTLNSMEDNLKLYRTKKNNYLLFTNSHLKIGTMIANKKGFGFVDIEGDEDVFIAPSNMNGAIHGDKVIVEITSPKGIDFEGRIVKIVDRKFKQMVGEIYYKKNIPYLKLDDERIRLTIEIDKKKTLGAMEGHKVIVKITNKLKNNMYKGEVIRILGHKNDPGVDILSITNEMGIPDTFSEEVMQEADKLPNEVFEKEKVGRRDLTNEVIFTIDGDDTKDIDDAISIDRKVNGNYVLGVHIADVSYYVKEGSPLDNDAMERGTSVYLVDRVIPMLPHELSNGICSLNPNVDRLAISCVMEFNSHGKLVDYEIFESVIKSRIQMTYKKVNKILENNEVPEGYEPYVKDLKMMNELADILRKAMFNRGYIDFEVDEAKILVDENCVPTEITLRERGTGEKLIEDFMIAANECVATHIYFMNLPFVYRVHEYPKEEKIRSFLGFISNLGYHVDGNVKDVKPTTMQKILEQLKDKPEYKILCTLLLRSMQKAVYKPENLGHYGLASTCYTHFTSPIRRYPDTTVHRLLHTYLFDNKLDMSTIKKWEERLVYITEHSSERERASVDCEREVEDMKMAEYMEKHIGEEYEGMISSVTSFGMFVELDNLIEGLVPIKDMDDFFHFDEERMTLTGEKSHIKYSIGERVIVKVVRASKEEKTIDFEIVRKVDGDGKKESKVEEES